jgi:hypothetical protein
LHGGEETVRRVRKLQRGARPVITRIGALLEAGLTAEINAVFDMAKRPFRRIKRTTIALWNARAVISGPFLLEGAASPIVSHRERSGAAIRPLRSPVRQTRIPTSQPVITISIAASLKRRARG